MERIRKEIFDLLERFAIVLNQDEKDELEKILKKILNSRNFI